MAWIPPDAARRVKTQSAARAPLHEMATGVRTRGTKRLTSAELAREAQAALAAAAVTAARSECAAVSKSAGAKSALGSQLPCGGADARVRVDEWLQRVFRSTRLVSAFSQVEVDFGSGLARLNADWTVDWHG